MKVFMLGWEFPPFISGGLGTACYGLTKALSQAGTEVTFVLPRAVSSEYTTHVRLASPTTISTRLSGRDVLGEEAFSNVTFRTIPSSLRPYVSPGSSQGSLQHKDCEKGTCPVCAGVGGLSEVDVASLLGDVGHGPHYGEDLYQQVQRYARLAAAIARDEEFDVIHAHDWMTYPAGMAVAAISGKPLVVHVHSTEFDRSGEHVNQLVYDIERQGMHNAALVITVSYLTKSIVMSRYAVPEHKIRVVYNAIERNGHLQPNPAESSIRKNEKIVLFLGRITMQKGPEYFLAAAKKVLEVMDNVKFVMAGSGDMIRHTIEMAANMGIGHKVLFTGFLRGGDVDRVFKMADLFVMPSVSEPFGLVPLEALRNDVPVLISKQSGVAEVLTHALKVDFWDVNEMANKIVAVLRHPPLQATLREHGNFEVRKLSWGDAASGCIETYESAVRTALAV
ncbi:MAG: glycosyltransferase family 4 protein [Sedimentisphaerales bacterium]|nr:glycosyltransferase family 4 protein [Sedimentisphaerales bacterium]